VPSAFTDAQRLAFGALAELYESARPSYPRAVVGVLRMVFDTRLCLAVRS
jgi:hypothetical protein